MRISDSEPKFIVDTLVLLSKDKMRGSLLDEMWKAHFIDRRVRLAFERLLGEDDAVLSVLNQGTLAPRATVVAGTAEVVGR